MARPRFHSHTESLVRGSGQNASLGLQNFNLLPVKDTNGRNGTNSNNNSGNNKMAIEEDDDIIPVKEAPLSVHPTVVATSSSTLTSPVPSKVVLPPEKEILIVDKDFDDKIKSNFIFCLNFSFDL